MADDDVFVQSGRWLKRLLILYGVVLAVDALASFATCAAIWGTAGADLSQGRLDVAGFSLLTIGGCSYAQLGVFIVIAILFLRLLYKAVKRAQTFKTPFTYVSAGWAVGYWFIPLMNLYRPLDVVKALFKACAAEAGTDAKPKAGEQLLGAWWAMFLLGGILERMLAYSDISLSTTAGTLSYVEYNFGIDLVLIAGTVLFAMVVKRLVEAVGTPSGRGG